MNMGEISPQIEQITQRLDRLIAEMTGLRRQVAALSHTSTSPHRSVRQSEYFGMWAGLDDAARSRCCGRGGFHDSLDEDSSSSVSEPCGEEGRGGSD